MCGVRRGYAFVALVVGMLALTNVSVGTQPVTVLRWGDLHRVGGGACWSEITPPCALVTKVCVETKCVAYGFPPVWKCPKGSEQQEQKQATYYDCTVSGTGYSDCFSNGTFDCLKVYECNAVYLNTAGCQFVNAGRYCVDGKLAGPPLRTEGTREEFLVSGIGCVTEK